MLEDHGGDDYCARFDTCSYHWYRLTELWFNDTSTLVGHNVSSPREIEIEELVEEMKERDWDEKATGIEVKKQKK